MARVQLEFSGNGRGAVGAAKETAAGIAQVRREATAAERDLGKLSRGALAGSGVFRGLGRSVAFASAGFLGGYGLTAAVAGAFGELEKGIQVTAQTNAALKSTGTVAGITAKGIHELALAEMRKTGADDDAIQSAENLLLTFRFVRNEAGKGNDIFNQSVKVTEDLSRAMGIDLNSAALQVGKALNDPERGMTRLQRIGVTFTNQQKEQVRQLLKTGDVLGAQKVILGELNLEFGKSAEQYGKTLPGAISRARETVRNFGAELLTGLTPQIRKGTDALQAWLANTDNQAKVQKTANTVIRDGTGVVQGIVGAVKDVAPIVQGAADAVGGFSNLVKGLLVLKVASTLSGWAGGISGLIGTAGAAEGAGGVGLLGARAAAVGLIGKLRALAAFGTIVIAVELVTNRQSVQDWIDKQAQDLRSGLKQKLGPLGFLVGGPPGDSSSITGRARSSVPGAPAVDFTTMNARQKKVVGFATEYGVGSGITYRWGGVSPVTGFDCSGYLYAAYAAAGVQIPRDTRGQWNDPNAVEVAPGSERPGDGVYFVGSLSGKNAGPPPGHVGIYVGNGQYIEYFSEGKPAKLSSLGDRSDYMGARRWAKISSSTGGGGSTYTPQNPADFKTKTKSKTVAAATLPGSIRLDLARAGATAGLADDITANEAAIAFLTGKLKTAKSKGVQADLQDAINGYRDAIKTAREKLASARKDATARLTEERGIAGQFATGRAAAEQAFALDLLPAGQEEKLRGQINRFGALIRKAEKDGKISPAELTGIKASWDAFGSGLTDAASAVAQHVQQVFDRNWSGITTSITRGISEKWAIVQRSFGRETDAGLRGITSAASRDIAAMAREFNKQLDAFDRETQAGLKGLAAPEETPTEALLRSRAEQRAAQDLQDRLAQDRASGDAKAVAQDLYDIETASLEETAKAERKAADAQAQQAQDAYQRQRDDLRQALQDREAEREAARQAQADAEAQAYQDQRDAQWQALQDSHDDQLTAFNADLAQWGAWLANKQRTYAEFLAWLASNPISQGLQGIGPSPYGDSTQLLPDTGFGRPATITGGFARGGRIPGQFIGRDDTVMARVTPGERVLDRDVNAMFERWARNGGPGGGPIVIQQDVYLDSRKISSGIANPMAAALDRRISYPQQI